MYTETDISSQCVCVCLQLMLGWDWKVKQFHNLHDVSANSLRSHDSLFSLNSPGFFQREYMYRKLYSQSQYWNLWFLPQMYRKLYSQSPCTLLVSSWLFWKLYGSDVVYVFTCTVGVVLHGIGTGSQQFLNCLVFGHKKRSHCHANNCVTAWAKLEPLVECQH